MKKLVLISICVFLSFGVLFILKGEKNHMMPRDAQGYVCVKTLDDVYSVYPKTVDEIKKRSQEVQTEVRKLIDGIVGLPVEKYSKETVLYALDRALSYCGVELGILELVHSAYDDMALRAAAEEQELILKSLILDKVTNNKPLYDVCKAYALSSSKDKLSSSERLFLDEVLADFKRSGLDLPQEQRDRIVELKKQEQKLSQEFSKNISQDQSTITVTLAQLDGISPEFIQALSKNEAGEYVLRTDYPTADMVLNYCNVEDTRKRFAKAFKNRAYPLNVEVLDKLIAVRNEIAQALGFASYAHLDLDNQMVKSPERALAFQMSMKSGMIEKGKQEFKKLTQDLPEGVSLTQDGKLEGFNSGYVSTYFKKKYYDIDELKISEYFPMEKTIQGLLHIYETFFDLSIDQIVNPKAWHPDVRLLKISDKNGAVRGYVFLDMFPRPNKYGHAAMFPGVVSLKRDATFYPTVTSVVCNFTKPTATKPSLLKFREVETFFHEFGHAIHGVLGATELFAQSGTHVKTDFVELPSQLLENWIEQPEILKGLSCHYQTGEQMPDELIGKKIKQITFGLGMHYARQITFGMIALDCFGDAKNKNVDAIVQKHSQEMSPYFVYDSETHMACNFGHLAGYGAKYYGYLWSRVFADDVFARIKQEGVLNPEAGARYVAYILGVGGSKNPNDMLRDYLEREPNSDAFMNGLVAE